MLCTGVKISPSHLTKSGWRVEQPAKNCSNGRTVIDMLKNGGKFHPKLDATLIEDDSIKAHLKRPNEAWDGGLMTLSGNKF